MAPKNVVVGKVVLVLDNTPRTGKPKPKGQGKPGPKRPKKQQRNPASAAGAKFNINATPFVPRITT